jgi:hypothetical protein
VVLAIEKQVPPAPAFLHETQLVVQPDGGLVGVHTSGVALLISAFPECITEQDAHGVFGVAFALVLPIDADPKAENARPSTSLQPRCFSREAFSSSVVVGSSMPSWRTCLDGLSSELMNNCCASSGRSGRSLTFSPCQK